MVYKPYNMQNKGESEEREVCWWNSESVCFNKGGHPLYI
jgi:hypothetical protein